MTHIKCAESIFFRGDKNGVNDVASFHFKKVSLEILIDSHLLEYQVIDILKSPGFLGSVQILQAYILILNLISAIHD